MPLCHSESRNVGVSCLFVCSEYVICVVCRTANTDIMCSVCVFIRVQEQFVCCLGPQPRVLSLPDAVSNAFKANHDVEVKGLTNSKSLKSVLDVCVEKGVVG